LYSIKNGAKMRIFIIIFLTTQIIFGQSNLILPSLFSDNMVIQQQSKIPIWGKGEPRTEVKINTEWGENVKSNVNDDSTWLVKVKTPKAGGPYTINISNESSSVLLQNVLVGEVWLCSGQSNMEMPLEGWPPNDIINNSEEEILNSNNSEIRFFTVARDISVLPKDDCIGEWVESASKSSASFSATAYFFGKKLYDELHIPIGLIHSSWGGTPAESWTSRKSLAELSEFNDILKKIDLSIPASKELATWLEKFPKIDMSKKTGKNIWSNLKFDDSECSEIELDHSDWNTMNLPTLWEATELGEFDGIVWFRKKIDLSESWINKDLKIELGPIDDFDITFVNGYKVGNIEEEGNWQTSRKYKIPANWNNKNSILISIRVNDNRGGGGIYGKSEEMKLVKDEDGSEISIAGEWHYLPVAEFRGMTYYVFGSNSQEFKNRPILPIELSANTPTLLYNAMIAPLVPFKIKGVIWYQGESNTGNPKLYEKLFPTMINNWRNDFGEFFPFYYVQIAPYDYGDETKSEFLRDAQRKTLSKENTGMAVTLDIGDTSNIHPPNKKDVGKRLALWALAKQYNKEIVYSGPIYKSQIIVENKIELEFDSVSEGIEIRDGKNLFKIAGDDKQFVNADTKIVNNKLIVWSEKIDNPKAVRYAWHNNATATFFNKSGLPASSFRTDNWAE
jgi:sialate O-acetylesterase